MAKNPPRKKATPPSKPAAAPAPARDNKPVPASFPKAAEKIAQEVAPPAAKSPAPAVPAPTPAKPAAAVPPAQAKTLPTAKAPASGTKSVTPGSKPGPVSAPALPLAKAASPSGAANPKSAAVSTTEAKAPATPVKEAPMGAKPAPASKTATKSDVSTPCSTSLQAPETAFASVKPAPVAAQPVAVAPAPATKGRRGRPPKINLASPAPAKPAPKSPEEVAALVAAAPSVPPTELKTRRPRRILFIASECTPLAQTGGLGDVVAGLSKALVRRGHDVRVIMPLYSSIDRAKYGITYQRSCCIHFGRGEEIWVGLHEGMLDNEVPVWFIDYERYFGRPWLYDGSDEDGFRFGVLSKGALQVCKDTGFIPHVVHLHDWMSSPTAVFLKTWDRVLSPLSHTGSVLTLHNIGYQGKFHRSVLDFYGLGPEFLTPDKFEDFGAANLLKAGIQYADFITTVSPTYAREIRDSVGGMGLGLYLNDRGDRVSGILNGVDTELWNPRTDKFLPARYSVDDLSGKAVCKRALQERLGLEVNPKIPIFSMVSRFAPQKGFDLLRGALPQALRDMVIQVVALGSGDAVTENFFRWLQGAFPGRVHATIGFSPELAHLIEAGSDFFLMPSYYEPCGLNQMYSSLYGTLPIVRATGGLDDTVDNYNEAAGTGTGFKFLDPTDRALFYTIGWAVSTWFDRPQHHAMLQRNGMKKDFSWTASARQYEDVYERAIACHV